MAEQLQGQGEEEGQGRCPTRSAIIGKSGARDAGPRRRRTRRGRRSTRMQNALAEPLRKGAELIMLAPSENGLAVRYQVDGMDYKGHDRSSGRPARTAVSLLKGAAGLDVNDRRKPQRAMVKLVVDGKRREYRLETAGSTAGEAARFMLDPKKRHDIPLRRARLHARARRTRCEQLIKEDRRGHRAGRGPEDDGHDGRAVRDHARRTTRSSSTCTRSSATPRARWRASPRTSSPANATPAEEQKVVGWVISQEPDAIMITRRRRPEVGPRR